jgi:hypothetical protein
MTLDVVGPAPQLATDGSTHLPGPVGFLVHRREQAAAGRRRRHDPSAGEDARTVGQAEADRLAQDHSFVIEGAHVADRGQAGAQPRSARLGQDEPAQLVRARLLTVEWRWRSEARTPFRVAQGVDVGIDETGEDGAALDIKGPVRRVVAGRVVGGVDAAIPDVDGDRAVGRPAGAIDQKGVPQCER